MSKGEGAGLRESRKQRGITQEELAQRSGVNRKTIGRIERGRGKPTVRTLEKLARALDVSLRELLPDADRVV